MLDPHVVVVVDDIQTDNLVAAGQKPLHEVIADETRRSRYQNFHSKPPINCVLVEKRLDVENHAVFLDQGANLELTEFLESHSQHQSAVGAVPRSALEQLDSVFVTNFVRVGVGIVDVNSASEVSQFGDD